jgi:hypothetical protein
MKPEKGLLAGVVAFALMTVLFAAVSSAQLGTGVFRVNGSSGTDNGVCGGTETPCMSIQQAVNLAGTGETILVAAGTYTYDSSLNLNCLNYTAVVCVKNKELTIHGGFGGGDWENADPDNNLTVIDGEDMYQGVHVRDVSATATASLELDGFTITRGRRQGATSGSDEDTSAFGGGLASYTSDVVLRDLVFSNNYAIGGDTNQTHGGGGIGGGVMLRTIPGLSILERVTFTGNYALGGSGVEKGGWGIGGGLFTNHGVVSLIDVAFSNNVSIAGSSNGSGAEDGQKADGQGGAIAFHTNAIATINGLTASGNSTTGGDAPNGLAGGGFGGAVYCELATSVSITDANIRENIAMGGEGDTGGLGAGGGIFDGTTPITLDRIQIIANQVIGGDGVTKQGAAGGGGVYFNRPASASPVPDAVVTNAIVADNLVQLGAGSGNSGGGGGFYFSRVGGVVTHSTFARNQLLNTPPMQGLAMSLLTLDGDSVVVDLSYSIISDHTSSSGSTPAIKVKELSTLNLSTGLFAGNEVDTNDGLIEAGTINGLDTMINTTSAGYFSPGAPDYDYHLTPSSQAKDEATGSTTPVDFENQDRWDGYPDIGADEEGPILLFTDGFESGNFSAWSSRAL